MQNTRRGILIGISGKKGHGKDTAAKHLEEKHNFRVIHFADPLKEACKSLFLMNDDQLYGSRKEEVDPRWGVSPRTVMQKLGTDICRVEMDKVIPGIGDSFWLRRLEIELIELLESGIDVVIADVRYPNEVQLVKKYNGTTLNIVRGEINTKDAHISENALNGTVFDHVINNDAGITELHERVEELYLTLTQ